MYGYKKIPTLLMRGGTSKGAFILTSDLPSDPLIRDQVILSIYGSPDVRQINGIGGADPLTSKVALISPSSRDDADIDYTFGYVGIEEAAIDYNGNCGNIISAAGPYAIYKGLVQAQEPITRVRIFNTNTNKVVVAHVPVCNGELALAGSYAISGVPGTSARIDMEFLHVGGEKTGALLPTGHVQDELTLSDGTTIPVTCCDAANPGVIVRAEDIGFTGLEMPDTPEGEALRQKMDEVRRLGAVLMGLAPTPEKASPAIPKIIVATTPQSFTTLQGQRIEKEQSHIVCRTLALQYLHKAYAITTGICTAVAAAIPGTVIYELKRKDCSHPSFCIGHPSGVLEVAVTVVNENGTYQVQKAAATRTAHLIMDGISFVPLSIWNGTEKVAEKIQTSS